MTPYARCLAGTLLVVSCAGCAFFERTPGKALGTIQANQPKLTIGTVSRAALEEGTVESTEADAAYVADIYLSSESKEKLCFTTTMSMNGVDPEEKLVASFTEGLKKSRFGVTTFGSLEELEARSWAELLVVPHEGKVLSTQFIKGEEYWRDGKLSRWQPTRDVTFEVCMATPAVPESARYLALLWFSRNDLAVWTIDD